MIVGWKCLLTCSQMIPLNRLGYKAREMWSVRCWTIVYNHESWLLGYKQIYSKLSESELDNRFIESSSVFIAWANQFHIQILLTKSSVYQLILHKLFWIPCILNYLQSRKCENVTNANRNIFKIFNSHLIQIAKMIPSKSNG